METVLVEESTFWWWGCPNCDTCNDEFGLYNRDTVSCKDCGEEYDYELGD